MQGPLRDSTRGPGFERSLRGVFQSTGSAEGGGGGDRSRLISVLRAEDRGWALKARVRGFGIRGAKQGSVGLVGLRICGRRWVVRGFA